MGFMDKVKSQAEQIAKQGQDKLDDMQAKKAAEGLLRDLGAWYYAVQTGRDNGQGAAELARITAELQSHEAEHGPLGGGGEAEGAEAAPAPPAGAPAAAPPPPPPAGQAPPPPAPAPPAPAGPPSQGTPPQSPPPPAGGSGSSSGTDVPPGGFTLDDM